MREVVKPYEPLYTVKEVAKILKINPQATYSLIKSHQLPSLRLGSIKVRGSDLERFLEKYPTIESGDDNMEVNDDGTVK